MPIKKTIKDKFKKVKNNQQRSMVDMNRESGNKVASALKDAELSTSGIENTNARKAFSSITNNFAQYIDSAPMIAEYDVSEFDSILLEMIDVYSKALKKGDLETAKRGIDRIHSALADFRKDLTTVEIPKKNEIVFERVDKMKKYKAVLTTSNAVYESYQNIQIKDKEYLEQYEAYEKLYARAKEEEEKHPNVYETLQSIRPGIDQVPEEAQEMDTILKKLEMIEMQVEDLKSTRAIFENDYNAQVESLKSLETMLSIHNSLLTKEEEEQINDAINRYHKQLQDAQLEAERLMELQEKRHSGIQELMTSMTAGKAAMKAVGAYEKMKRKEQMRIEDEERGRILAQERKEKQKQDNKTVLAQ